MPQAWASSASVRLKAGDNHAGVSAARVALVVQAGGGTLLEASGPLNWN